MKLNEYGYQKVAKKDLAPMVTSNDPLNSSRLPVNVPLTCLPELVSVPATGRITKPWNAIVMEDAKKDVYFVSPRVFLGLAFKNQKMEAIIERKFIGKKPLIDFLADSPKVIVTGYEDYQVDNFDDNSKSDTKAFPIITLAEPKPNKKDK